MSVQQERIMDLLRAQMPVLGISHNLKINKTQICLLSDLDSIGRVKQVQNKNIPHI